MSNQKFSRIFKQNDYFVQFLLDIGFHKSHGTCPEGTDAKYKFSKMSIPEVGVTAVIDPDN